MKFQVAFYLLVPFLFTGCTSYESLIEQGKELSQSGKNEEAIRIFNQAKAKNKKRIEAYYGLGFAHSSLCEANPKDCQKGLDYFSFVIAQDSNYRHAMYNRAYCYMVMEQYQKALLDLNSVICLENEKLDPNYFMNKTYCNLLLGDTLTAYENYTEAINLNFNEQTEHLEVLFQEFQLNKTE